MKSLPSSLCTDESNMNELVLMWENQTMTQTLINFDQ